MDKESLRSTLFFTLPATGSALIAEIILESAIKPDAVELLLEKNHTRYMVQTIMGVLMLLSPGCLDEKKADRIIEDAKIQIDLEIKKAEQLLNKHVSDLSVKILKKSLPKIISDKEQAEIVTKAIKEFEKKVN